jgi:hypothetical protein
MKDNVLIEGGYGSRKIASFQRSREDSLRHSGASHVVRKSSKKSGSWSRPEAGVRRR